MIMNQWTIEVGEENFATEVLDRSSELPVLVDFWAPWCGPCRVLGPLLEKLAEEYAGEFLLAKINVDENPALANDFRIQGIPAVKLFRDGEVAGEFTGALPEPMLREMLGRFLPSQSDKLAREAISLQEAGKVEEAKAVYNAVLQKDSNHSKALLNLGRLLLQEGDQRGTLELLERISLTAKERKEAEPLLARLRLQSDGRQDEAGLRDAVNADPTNLETRLNLARTLAGKEKYEEALSELLDIVKTDRHFQDDSARKAMIQIFEVLGSDNPLTDRYRSELAKVLFS
jgi:putative thioredoxin